jgi:hypothetical protein
MNDLVGSHGQCGIALAIQGLALMARLASEQIAEGYPGRAVYEVGDQQ